VTKETVVRKDRLQTALLDALEELIKAHDAKEACQKFLRATVFMLNCPSAFIALAHQGVANSLSVVACVGDEFNDPSTQELLTIAAISNNWQSFSAKFECAYTRGTQGGAHSFSGFPIYKTSDEPYGFLALPSDFPVPSQFQDVILPSLVSLLAHRLREFDLLHEIDPLVQNERTDVIRERGVRFPRKEDFFDKSVHNVNGLLTVASLQAQMLYGAEAPEGSRDQKLDRLLTSIKKIGDLIEIQEEATKVLLSSSPVVSFQSCLNLSLETFNIGMKTSPKMAVESNFDDSFIAIRGVVLHWMLHNFFRQISTVAQPSGADEDPKILIEVNRSGNDSEPILDLVVSLDINSNGHEIVSSHFNAATSGALKNRYATSIFDHVGCLVEVLGWTVQFSTQSGNISFSVSIPCVPPKT
jgi:hypothetical protein